MTLHRAAAVVALGLTVSACGGGGGGGGIQTAAPAAPAPAAPAPAAPAPATPAPATPAPVTVSITGPASTGVSGVGSPVFNFTNNLPPVGTVFHIGGPVVQKTATSVSNGGFPTNEPRLTFRGTVTSNGRTYPIFDFSIANVVTVANLRADGSTGITDNGGKVNLGINALNYTMIGAWSYTGPGDSPYFLGHFATGSVTSGAALPVSGTATYTGNGAPSGVIGTYFVPSGSDTISSGVLSGNVSMNVDFATNAVSGQFTNMTAKPLSGGASVPWNDVTLSGSLMRASGVSVGGTTAAAPPAGAGSTGFSSSAVGSFSSYFYGPAYNEVGGTWKLSETTPDGGKAAFGTFAGAR